MEWYDSEGEPREFFRATGNHSLLGKVVRIRYTRGVVHEFQWGRVLQIGEGLIRFEPLIFRPGHSVATEQGSNVPSVPTTALSRPLVFEPLKQPKRWDVGRYDDWCLAFFPISHFGSLEIVPDARIIRPGSGPGPEAPRPAHPDIDGEV